MSSPILPLDFLPASIYSLNQQLNYRAAAVLALWYSVNDSPAHRQLALETARKSIVLLKNEGQTLPLSKALKTIAVIGPDADDAEILLGNYNGEPSAPVAPLAGIRRKLGSRAQVLYARGSDLAANLPNFQTIPTAALFTSNGPGRRPGLNAEYFASASFDGKRHRPRELTYPSSGQLVGQVPAGPKPLFTRIDPQIDFQWWDTAPRRDMNDDDFGGLDRISHRAGERQVSARRHRHECLRALLRRQAHRQPQQHP